MEGRKQSGSSLASDLFGATDSSAAASSSGIFGSIFAPPSKVIKAISFFFHNFAMRFWLNFCFIG